MANYVVLITCDAPASEEQFYFENTTPEEINKWWELYYSNYMADYEYYAYDIWDTEREHYYDENYDNLDDDFYNSREYEEFYGSGGIEIIEVTEENEEDFYLDEMERIKL